MIHASFVLIRAKYPPLARAVGRLRYITANAVYIHHGAIFLRNGYTGPKKLFKNG
jgi:hypothetical protein